MPGGLGRRRGTGRGRIGRLKIIIHEEEELIAAIEERDEILGLGGVTWVLARIHCLILKFIIQRRSISMRS